MRNSDVIVVGAGPAGSIAALVLARAGVRVSLIDRARFPRDKLCGDTLNPGALAILDRHGMDFGPSGTERFAALAAGNLGDPTMAGLDTAFGGGHYCGKEFRQRAYPASPLRTPECPGCTRSSPSRCLRRRTFPPRRPPAR